MDNRNLLLAIVLSVGILLIYQFLVVEPERARQATLQAEQAAAAGMEGDAIAAPRLSDGAVVTPGAFDTRDDALASASRRVLIDTLAVDGSINLTGARLDDLKLKRYRETLDENSPEITLLTPFGAPEAYYVVHGWTGGAGAPGSLPGPKTQWEQIAGGTLTQDAPVTLSYKTGDLTFTRTISIDADYMFKIEDQVTNSGAAPVRIAPYGLLNRHGIPGDLENFMILHEGPVAVLDGKLTERKYKKVVNDGGFEGSSTGGWIGLTDKYWLGALIPPQTETFKGAVKNAAGPNAVEPLFQANFVGAAREIPAGGSVAFESHLFAGAKKVNLLRSYEKPVAEGGLGVEGFDRAVDWGNLFFLTKPIFFVLDFLNSAVGNFGVAILILTLLIKLILFPLANKAYESMTKMKKLQPEIMKLRERYADDKMKQQQEMMAIYQKEKLNPLAGCLPVLVQIPIFYALYKTLFVTIELRHAPFFGWIRDLSEPDPTSIFNLFGLLPYDPMAMPVIGAFLGIGVLPLLMGVGMWFQMKLNPPPQDPIQQQVFALMPIFFTVLMAGFAAGLVLYWTWNTLLSIAQQYVIMRRMGVEIEWGDRFKTPAFVNRLMGKAEEAAPAAKPAAPPAGSDDKAK